jgi:hypothetical protein
MDAGKKSERRPGGSIEDAGGKADRINDFEYKLVTTGGASIWGKYNQE